MFDNEEFSREILEHPGMLQRSVLQELSDRTGGKRVPTDPNNGFMFLLEAGSSMATQFVHRTERVFEELYPRRATKSEQLYRHMSDFDYLKLTAKPAGTSMVLTLDRAELTKRALQFNEHYKKVVIPATSVFTVGDRRFGIYYPIEIRINMLTDNIIVTHDASSTNPMHELGTNLVDYVTHDQNGLKLLKMVIPVYQFERASHVETVVIEQGFNVIYPYTNKFYAARVWTLLNNKWQELAYTLSEDIYDRTVATAKILLMTDQNKVRVNIPQVYLAKGLVGKQIRVEIYTTEGSIDIPVTANEARNCKVDFDLRSDTSTVYSSALENLTLHILTPSESRIIGGGDNISFEELRRRVVYGTITDGVPITPLDLETFVSDNGFSLTKYLDNVTGRIYYANKKLLSSTSDRSTIPVTTANIELTDDTVSGTESILSFADNMITILPTTIYEYSTSSGVCKPLIDTARNTLQANIGRDLVDALNAKTYTRSPFHIVTYTDGKYPSSKTFDLNNPTVHRLKFIRENVNAAAQMVVMTSLVLHNGFGTGGYTVRLGVSKTKDLTDIAESDVYVLLLTTDKSGRQVYARATHVGATDVLDIYEAYIPSSYHISKDGYIRTLLNTDSSTTVSCDLPLSTTFDVRMMVASSALPDVAGEFAITNGIPSEFTGHVGLVQQELSVTLGEDLSDGVFNITDAVFSAETYVTYPEDIYHTYPKDVYETDASGALVYTTDVNGVVLNKLHSAGDVVLDVDSNPVVKHSLGDIKRDDDGNPIVSRSRSIIYYVEALMFDARMYASQSEQDIAYMERLSGELAAYIATIRTMQGRMFEETKLFFRPIRTIGTSTFGLGNGSTAVLDLGLAFTIKYYITRGVMKDSALKKVIEERTKEVIDSHMSDPVISLTEISKDLKTTLSDHIVSIDALGINGSPTLQTLLIQEDDVSPMTASKLVYNPDGTMTMEKDISVEFLIAK